MRDSPGFAGGSGAGGGPGGSGGASGDRDGAVAVVAGPGCVAAPPARRGGGPPRCGAAPGFAPGAGAAGPSLRAAPLITAPGRTGNAGGIHDTMIGSRVVPSTKRRTTRLPAPWASMTSGLPGVVSDRPTELKVSG